MCSICGIYDVNPLPANSDYVIKAMGGVMEHRGPDQNGIFLRENTAFQHNRLAIIDIENGMQPISRTYKGNKYTIVYNGEIYNTPELTSLIKKSGISLASYCDTEVVLYTYILFGSKCSEMLNGIFAFAVYDEEKNELYLSRDRFGIKPLFYTFEGSILIFASELKSLLKHPLINPDVDLIGLWQLLYLSPVKLNGTSVFKNILELLPAHYAVYGENGFSSKSYWSLQPQTCMESRNEVIEITRNLVTDAITRQLVSDVPLCTLLSGGLDSSIITSVAAKKYKEHGQRLSTYSFEYERNKDNFKSSLFQPQSDDKYASYLAEHLGTDHHILTVPTNDLANLLENATCARDMPGQADIDSSLLYFCSLIKENHTVAVSGECADEIFGGYPWFYKKEMLNKPFFPWIHGPKATISLFNDNIVHIQEGYNYISEQYKKSIDTCPMLETDNETMKQSRIATWLSINYFMTSLLERKDRMSIASSVEIRVPFADHRIIEYVYNVPWEIKFENGIEKSLLRNSMSFCLPDKILNRKKSPYPKTQNPEYEKLVRKMLKSRLSQSGSVLSNFIDKKAFEAFLNSESTTWFGQLMSKPQMIAWLLQFDIWAEKYNVNFLI